MYYTPEDDGEEVAGRSKKVWVILMSLLLLLLVVISGGAAFWGLEQRNSPVHAAQEWFGAIWEGDGKTVMDRTCDQERWVSDLVNGGQLLSGFIDFFEIAIPNVDIDGLNISTDREQIKFELVEESENAAVLRVNGRLQIQVLGAWSFYRLNETWVMIREDDQWRWCGRAR